MKKLTVAALVAAAIFAFATAAQATRWAVNQSTEIMSPTMFLDGLTLQSPFVTLRAEYPSRVELWDTLSVRWNNSQGKRNVREFVFSENVVTLDLTAPLQDGVKSVEIWILFAMKYNSDYIRLVDVATGESFKYWSGLTPGPSTGPRPVGSKSNANRTYIPVIETGPDLWADPDNVGFFIYPTVEVDNRSLPVLGSIMVFRSPQNIEFRNAGGKRIWVGDNVLPNELRKGFTFRFRLDESVYILVYAPDLGPRAYAVLHFSKDLIRLVTDKTEMRYSGLVLPDQAQAPVTKTSPGRSLGHPKPAAAIEATSWGSIKSQFNK